jgi:MFS family permease
MSELTFFAFRLTGKREIKRDVSLQNIQMKSRTQKLNSTAFAFALRLFLMGVESAVILPSIWQYLQMFHADYWYLGLVLSVYSAVPVASAILVARLADRGKVNILLLGLVLNLFEVAIINISFVYVT